MQIGNEDLKMGTEVLTTDLLQHKFGLTISHTRGVVKEKVGENTYKVFIRLPKIFVELVAGRDFFPIEQENTEKETFESAKVGDMVYDLNMNEFGKITEISPDAELPLEVTFRNGDVEYYSFEGINNFWFRSLYWDIPLIISPKRKIILDSEQMIDYFKS